MERPILDALRRLVLTAFVVYVLSVAGWTALVLGLLAIVLDWVFWPLLVGLGLLLVAVGLGWWAYRAVQRAYAERKRRPGPSRVFLSFRTAEHLESVRAIAKALKDAGLEAVFFDRDLEGAPRRTLAPDPLLAALGGVHTASGGPRLFRLGGLDAELQRELMGCDAMIFCIPTSRTQTSKWRSFLDLLDSLWFTLVFFSGFSITFWRLAWYGAMHGKVVLPKIRLGPFESWQSWERQLANRLELEVIDLALVDHDDAMRVAQDHDAATISQASNPRGPVFTNLNSLNRDIEVRVLPRIRQIRRQPFPSTGLVPAGVLIMAAQLSYKMAGILILIGAMTYLLLRWLL